MEKDGGTAPPTVLGQDLQVQCAIVGGGMAGLLTALFLERNGVEAVVLEADRVAGGQTGNTTAKITAQHGMIYHKLLDTLGRERPSNMPTPTNGPLSNTARSPGIWGFPAGWRSFPPTCIPGWRKSLCAGGRRCQIFRL